MVDYEKENDAIDENSITGKRATPHCFDTAAPVHRHSQITSKGSGKCGENAITGTVQDQRRSEGTRTFPGLQVCSSKYSRWSVVSTQKNNR